MQSPKFISLEERMWLKFETEDLDILQLGVLNSHLHEVLNQVAITMFQVHDDLQKSLGKEPTLPFIPQTYNRQDALISARICSLKRESPLQMELAAYAAAIFSQPGAVAVIHSLFANAIWAIGAYGTKVPGVLVRRIRGRDDLGTFVRPQAGRKLLRPKIEKFIKQLSESGNGGRLHFRSKDEELEIEFYGRNK